VASVFKRGGKQNKGGYYYLSWFDHSGKRRTKCARTTDKATAERIAAKYEAEAAARREGVIDATMERFTIEARRPISQHIAEYKAHLSARQNTKKHVDQTVIQVEAIVSACNVQTAHDLTGAGVMQAIDGIRRFGTQRVDKTGKRIPMSLRTCNSYLRSIKSFTRWLWMEKRSHDDLLIGLRGFNEEADRRHRRRELTSDEIGYLLQFVSTYTTPKHNLPGPDRAMLYRLALGTGFRAAELRSLKPESFDLQATSATVKVAAAYSKRRREDTQPLADDLAIRLEEWLAGHPRGQLLFGAMPGGTARMLRADLTAARRSWIGDAQGNELERLRREESDFLCYRNAAGAVADFHSTRHTFISGIVAGGASVKVAQELARHSTSRLTVDRYAHTRLNDLQNALSTLPNFDVQPDAHTQVGAQQDSEADYVTAYEETGAQRVAQHLWRERTRSSARPGEDRMEYLVKHQPPDAGNPAEKAATEHPLRALLGGGSRGAGESRTHDLGFAIRCLSHLATAPCSRCA